MHVFVNVCTVPKGAVVRKPSCGEGFSSIVDIIGLCRSVNVTDTYITKYLWVWFLNLTSLSTEMCSSKDSCKRLKNIPTLVLQSKSLSLLLCPLASANKVMGVNRWTSICMESYLMFFLTFSSKYPHISVPIYV